MLYVVLIILCRLILKLFNIEQVHISGKGKWFTNAQVITTILILRKRCDNDNIRDVSETNFFLWKRSLSELANSELRENLIPAFLQNLEVDGDTIKSKKYSQKMIDTILSYNLSKTRYFIMYLGLLKQDINFTAKILFLKYFVASGEE